MSRFSKNQERYPPHDVMNTILVEGSFQCHVCGKYADEATYTPERELLVWKCDEGHKSFIEKFRL